MTSDTRDYLIESLGFSGHTSLTYKEAVDEIARLRTDLATAEKRGWNAAIDAASDSLLPNDGSGLKNLSPHHFVYERIRALAKP